MSKNTLIFMISLFIINSISSEDLEAVTKTGTREELVKTAYNEEVTTTEKKGIDFSQFDVAPEWVVLWKETWSKQDYTFKQFSDNGWTVQ